MRIPLLFLGIFFSTEFCFAQQLSVNHFLEASSFSSQKASNLFSKKGYVQAGRSFQSDTVVNTWQQLIKPTASDSSEKIRRICRYDFNRQVDFSFQTPVKEEYISAISYLKNNGFFCGNEDDNPDSAYLFQRRNITVQTSRFLEDDIQYYSLSFHQQSPPPHAVQFAEDLLQFTSHEYLVSFFGAENVTRDTYFFSEKELNKCSVLFPNSRRQVVFIWKDELNLRDLSHILIGGTVNTGSSMDFNRQIRENNWSLTNGIHFNMRLSELVDLNGQDIHFFGKSSDNFLTVMPNTRGQIDFSSTGVILDCLNCNVSPVLEKKIISASEAIDNQLSLHVGMILLMPGKVSTGH